MAISREVKTGILVIAGILLLYLGYKFLDNSAIFNKSRVYHVQYENVAGLAASAPVTVNGLEVGNVERIEFTGDSAELLVTFKVDTDFQFSKTSTVQIYSSGFIGGNNLAIIPDFTNKEIAQSGDMLKGEIQQGMIDGIMDKFAPLSEGLESTVIALDTLLSNLNEVLDDKTKNNLKSSIANLNSTLVSFNGVSKDIKGMLDNNKEKLNSTFANLDITSKNFAKLSDSLAQLEIGQMTKDMQNMIAKFETITTRIDNGEGSVGKLLKDEELYNNLTGASAELEKLLEDMKLNPKRYVHFSLFGKKAKQYETPNETNE